MLAGVMELFTFMYVRGELGRVTFLPIHQDSRLVDPEVDEYTVEDPALREIFEQFAAFDARDAQCFIKSDRHMLLGVIESGLGSLDAFNEMVRKIFASKAPSQPSASSPSMKMIQVGVSSRRPSSKPELL